MVDKSDNTLKAERGQSGKKLEVSYRNEKLSYIRRHTEVFYNPTLAE